MIKLTEKDLRSYHERFYIYVYLDPRKPGKYSYEGLDVSFLYEPFYVGKGQGNRHESHIYEAKSNYPQTKNKMKLNKIRKIINEYHGNPFVEKIHENNLEISTFEKETHFITTIGRSDLINGPLTNLTDGGEGSVGFIATDEYREKMSIAIKNRNWRPTPEYLEKLRKASTGRRHTEESKKKLSIANTGKKHSEEAKKKISIASSSYRHSEESKKKLSESHKGKKHSEESKKKLSDSHKGKKHSDETKKQMSLSRKGRKHTDETREKMSKSQTGLSKGKGKANSRAKIWTLLNDDGRQIIVEDLVGFCNEHNLCYTWLKQTLKHPHYSSHKGWKVILSRDKKSLE